MLEIIDYVILFLIGILGGFLSGLLGIGGGIVYVAVLRFYISRFDIPDEEAVKFILSNSIIGTFFAGVAGTFRQASHKYFFPREIIIIGLAAVVASLSTTGSIVQFDWYSARSFNIFFLLVMLFIAFNFMFLRQRGEEIIPANGEKPPLSPWPILIIIGLSTGVFSALSGLGGGVVLVFMLTKFLHFNIRKAASISLGSIPIQALAVGIFYSLSQSPVTHRLPPLTVGYVIIPILAPILAGIVLGSPWGVKLAHRLEPKYIRIIFAVLIFIIIIQTLYEYFQG